MINLFKIQTRSNPLQDDMKYKPILKTKNN